MIFPRMRSASTVRPPPGPAQKEGEIALKSETQYLSPMSNSYIVSERAKERTNERERRGRPVVVAVDVSAAKESRTGIISRPSALRRSARPMGKNICLA